MLNPEMAFINQKLNGSTSGSGPAFDNRQPTKADREVRLDCTNPGGKADPGKGRLPTVCFVRNTTD